MDVIKLTRELGKAIQQDDRYIAYNLAKKVNDEDAVLQADIERFSEIRKEINEAMCNEDLNKDNLVELDTEMKTVYQKIMSNPNMIVFQGAQTALEDLVNNINQIISMCANGEDPDTCEPQKAGGCTGSCSTCGGCG
ncbi:MAG: YlbF family regulator [Ruminococcus sp.]|nr:YlbF family regulator [Ruminococcus sp.]